MLPLPSEMIRQKVAAPITTLFYVFFLSPFSFTNGQVTVPFHNCSSSCGELRNISHPFRLQGDPIGCGDGDFELSCEDNKAALVIDSTKYYVKEISHPQHKIRVIDIAFVNATCRIPNNSLSADEIDRDKRFLDGTFSWASFVRCSKEVDDPNYAKVPCASKMYEHVYVIYDNYNSMLSDLSESCTFLAMVPALRRSVANPSFSAIWNILLMGFELEWSIACRDCRRSGGFCSSSGGCLPLPDGILTIKSFVLLGLNLIAAVILVLLLVGRFILAPISIYVFLLHKFRKNSISIDPVEQFLRIQQKLTPVRYSYNDLLGMTNHFNEKLGQGGFGSVFKGKLPFDRSIAVKMLGNSDFKGEDFISEVSTIGRIHHVNVVRLIGFCSEGSHRALVYEYMPNGSLDKYIFTKKGRNIHPFSRQKLHEIALGIARGIEYLHQGCDMCILHFDIKPHNILLDHDFTPKVSDFGLAKLYPKDYDSVSVSNARGTIGYIAPELISRNFGIVSYKSDVYSFGMLLLEMAGRRRNVDENVQNSSLVYFPTWVYDRLNQGEELEIENATETEKEIVRKMCIVGLWCIQMNPANRPSMSKVVEMLEGHCNALQMPPKPFFCSPPQSNHCSSSSSPHDQSNHYSSSSHVELSIISELE